MAKNLRLNRAGFQQVRRAPALIAQIDKITAGIASRANSNPEGGEYKTSSLQGAARPQGRWRGTVITGDYKAQKDNGKNNTLIKEFNRARGG